MIIIILNPDWLKMDYWIHCCFVVRNDLGLHLVRLWRKKQGKGILPFFCRLQIYFFSAEWLPPYFCKLIFFSEQTREIPRWHWSAAICGTNTFKYVDQSGANTFRQIVDISGAEIQSSKSPQFKILQQLCWQESLMLSIFPRWLRGQSWFSPSFINISRFPC